jgi:hypothetical protein
MLYRDNKTRSISGYIGETKAYINCLFINTT